MVADAIAALQFNNQMHRSKRLPVLREMYIPWLGQTAFYLVPETQEPSDAVVQGRWLNVETIVTTCEPSPTRKLGLKMSGCPPVLCHVPEACREEMASRFGQNLYVYLYCF